MNKFGNLIDECIKETIDEVLSRRELPDVQFFIPVCGCWKMQFKRQRLMLKLLT